MTRLRRVHCCCRGFNLVEMMVALGLMGIFLLLAGQVFGFTVNTFHQTGRHLNNMAISEAAFERLRQDVWTARHLKVMHGRTVFLRLWAGIQAPLDSMDAGPQWPVVPAYLIGPEKSLVRPGSPAEDPR